MSNTSYSDSNKIANQFFIAESAYTISAERLQKQAERFFQVNEYRRKPVGAPDSAGYDVITFGISDVDKMFMEIDLSIHINRLVEYADAYVKYHAHDPSVERSMAIPALNTADIAQRFGMEQDSKDLWTFAQQFVIDRFKDKYNKFRSHQSLETLLAVIVVIEEMQQLGIDATSDVKKTMMELNNMDLTQYGLSPNFTFGL